MSASTPLIRGENPPKQQVAWGPQPGKQTAAVECPVNELFYGGARGGGKTDFLLGDFLIHQGKYGKHAHGIIFRRTLTEMTEIERRSHQIYAPLGAKYNSQKHEWKFPKGGTLLLRYLDKDKDADNYQGHSYTWVGVDEVGNFPNPEPIDKIRATLRSAHGVPCYLRLTGNPGGPGHNWVKERYIRKGPFQIFSYQPQPEEAPQIWSQAVFIPAQLEDNILLMQNDPDYESKIAAAGGKQLYKAWRYGDWDAIVGAVFDEWRRDLHVIDNPDYEAPPGWTLAGGMDWGYRAPGWFGLFATGPDGDVVCLDEIYFRQQTGPDVGRSVGLMCRKYGPVQYIAGDEQMWYQTGVSSPTIAEEVQEGIFKAFGKNGRTFAPVLIQASHGRGSRLTKLQVMHRYLAWKADATGNVAPWNQPLLKFHVKAKNAIRTLPSLTYDDNHPEDVDTDAEDHPYDGVCAFLMSRPPPGERIQGAPDFNRHPGFDKGGRKKKWMQYLEDKAYKEGADRDLVRYPGGIL